MPRITVMRTLIFLAAQVLLGYHINSWSGEMTAAETQLAKGTAHLDGDQILAEAQEEALLKEIAPGMSLLEAQSAGGTFLYRMERDPNVWSDDVNPLVIIDQQETAPDESKIWLTFENAVQFPGEGKQRFEVYFVRGKAQEIRRLAPNQPHPAEIAAEILLKQNNPTPPDAEINESDYGEYTIFHRRDYLPTGFFFRLSKTDDKWVTEGKVAGGDWEKISCDNECEYRTSFDIEVQRYFPPDWLANADITCIQNPAQAFCRITRKKDAARLGHMLISLSTGTAIPVLIRRFTWPKPDQH